MEDMNHLQEVNLELGFASEAPSISKEFHLTCPHNIHGNLHNVLISQRAFCI